MRARGRDVVLRCAPGAAEAIAEAIALIRGGAEAALIRLDEDRRPWDRECPALRLTVGAIRIVLPELDGWPRRGSDRDPMNPCDVAENLAEALERRVPYSDLQSRDEALCDHAREVAAMCHAAARAESPDALEAAAVDGLVAWEIGTAANGDPVTYIDADALHPLPSAGALAAIGRLVPVHLVAETAPGGKPDTIIQPCLDENGGIWADTRDGDPVGTMRILRAIGIAGHKCHDQKALETRRPHVLSQRS